MILTVTREEVEKIIKDFYSLPEDVKVLISNDAIYYKNHLNSAYGKMVDNRIHYDQVAAHTDTVPQLEVTVNKENQVEAIKEAFKGGATYADTDSIKKELHIERPKNTRLTKEELDAIYERYADTVEHFLNSGKKEQFLDLEGRSASGIRYRYNTAIKMYGFDDQCYAVATDHGLGKSTARLIRKDKVK